VASAVEYQQLMPDQHGFGHNGTESTRPYQSGHGDHQMNEQDEKVAHPGNGISTSRTTAFYLAIRHGPDATVKFACTRILQYFRKNDWARVAVDPTGCKNSNPEKRTADNRY
jgi:hypothetical protein